MSDKLKNIFVGALDEFLERAAAYDLCDSVMAVMDVECNVLYHNQAYDDFSKALFITKQFTELEDAAFTIKQLQNSISQCVLKKQPVSVSAQVYFQRQISMPLTIQLRPILNHEKNEVLATLLSLADENIGYGNLQLAREKSELKDLQLRIKNISVENYEQQRVIRTLLNDTPFAIMIVDSDKHITQINRACEKILNVTRRDTIGHSSERYLSDNEVSYGSPKLINKMDGFQYESFAICGNGARRNILRSSVRMGEGAKSMTMEAFIDVTENKNIEEEINLYKKHLEELVEERTTELDEALSKAELASKAKTEFLSRVSHELRTPLNAILGFTQLLEMETNNYPHLQGQVGEISVAGKHLLNLVNEVLDLSQIEQGRVSIHLEAVPLQETIEETIKYVEPMAQANNITIVKNLCGKPCSALADTLRLREILLNLLSNAVKYNRSNGQVTVSCDEDDQGRISVSVADTGLGLNREQIKQLFEPFSRLGAEYTEIEGSGIGLTIVKRMLELMQGTISVASQLDEGSCFTLYLPSAEGVEFTETPLAEQRYR